MMSSSTCCGVGRLDRRPSYRVVVVVVGGIVSSSCPVICPCFLLLVGGFSDAKSDQ